MPRLRPLLVGLSLAALATAQAAAALRLPLPLEGVEIRATKENYGFSTDGREMTVTFQLRNEGDEQVRVTGLGEDLPGLALEDVTAAGEPFGFRSAGEGPDPLPAFDLAADAVVVLAMTYRLVSCGEVPDDARPVPLVVREGRGRGTVRAGLPPLPDDALDAGEEDLVEWQTVLVRELCA